MCIRTCRDWCHSLKNPQWSWEKIRSGSRYWPEQLASGTSAKRGLLHPFPENCYWICCIFYTKPLLYDSWYIGLLQTNTNYLPLKVSFHRFPEQCCTGVFTFIPSVVHIVPGRTSTEETCWLPSATHCCSSPGRIRPLLLLWHCRAYMSSVGLRSVFLYQVHTDSYEN